MKNNVHVFSFVVYYIFNHFLCEKHTTNFTTFQILGGGNIHNVLRNFLLYVFTACFFRILFNNDANYIQFCQKMAKKMVPKLDF